MTWPVRSKRLAFYTATPAANTSILLGTVPTGKTWLIKEWTAYNAGANTRDLYLQLFSGGVGVNVDKITGLTAGNLVYKADHHLVLTAAEEVRFLSSTAQAVNITVHGAELG